MVEEEFNFEKFKKISNKSRYERRIAQLSKDKETKNIEEVVNTSIKNIKDGERSFIIYGDPQCGKTEMMIALTAKLLDEGHRVIVLLITDNVSLLKQNLERFRNSGIDPSPKNFNEVLDENIKIGEGNWIIFCKKNASNLKNLNDKLKEISNKVIIDDEADFATPNSRINQPDISKINQLTGELIGDGIYIGVTATPARLDLNNTHNNKNQKWVCFKPHSKYTGQEIFFPIDVENLSYRLVFLPDDNPEYISNALFSFMVNVAHLNLRVNSPEKNYSFLVHTSGKTEDHSRDYQHILKVFSTLANKEDSDCEKYIKNIWKIAKERYPGEEDEIVSYIIENNQRNNTIIMNSIHDFNREGSSIADPSTLFTIVLGGNIISRGVTFNNLLSMFFTRGVKNKFHQDTYIQRARMFGSRGEYLKYFELFIPRELYLNWHNCFVLHRLSLESINSKNGPPVWVYDDKIAVTSRSSIDSSSVLSDSGEMGFALFDFKEVEVTDILNKKNSNLDKLKELASLIGDQALPPFLIRYIEKNSNSTEESIKIYSPFSPKWKDVDQESLRRAKGFISTSSKGFYDFGHHIQIIFNDKKKARIYYKPSGKRLGFIKNIKWD